MASYVLYKDKLTGDYLYVFDKAETYAMTLGMDEKQNEEMLMELLDTLYEAQRKHKPVEKIIGADVEQFCRDYYAGNDNRFTNWIKDFPNLIYRMSVIIFVFSLLELLMPEEPYDSVFEATVNLNYVLSGSICGLLIGAFMIMITKLFLFRHKKFSNNVYLAILLVAFIGAVVLSVSLFDTVAIQVPLVLTVGISGIYIIIYKALQFYDRYQKYGSIKKPQEEKDISFTAVFRDVWKQESENQSMLLELYKQYEKKNERLRKKGKEPISEEAFEQKMRKQFKNMKININIYFYIALFLVCVLVPVANEMINHSAWYDILTLAVLLIVVEFLICTAFYKMAKSTYEARRQFHAQCDAEGITLVELARRVKAEQEMQAQSGGERQETQKESGEDSCL